MCIGEVAVSAYRNAASRPEIDFIFFYLLNQKNKNNIKIIAHSILPKLNYKEFQILNFLIYLNEYRHLLACNSFVTTALYICIIIQVMNE